MLWKCYRMTERLLLSQNLNRLLCLILTQIPRLLPVIVIGVASWLIRRPNVALAGAEAPSFVVGGEAVHGGTLSREIAKAGGGLVASAWTGLVAGGLHTLTGPDHLAALAPLCIGRSRLQSFSVGALWGCGHDAGQVIFGIIFLLLKDRYASIRFRILY